MARPRDGPAGGGGSEKNCGGSAAVDTSRGATVSPGAPAVKPEPPPALAAALEYATKGWPVLPLHGIRGGRCTCRGKEKCKPGKHPRTVHGLDDASTDPATIKSWWTRWPNSNVGLVTGAASGRVVLDVDPQHGGNVGLADLLAKHGALPETVEALTGGGGRHIHLKHPGGTIRNSSGKLGPGLDLKGDGAYVVAPPSLHVSGRRYEWEASSHPNDVGLAECPAWLLALLDGRGQGAPAAAGQAAAPAAPEAITEGRRNSELTSIAGRLRRAGLAEAELAAALLETNRRRCKPPLDDAEVKAIAASITRYPPGDDEPQLEKVARNRTDTGNAARLVLKHGDNLRYVPAWGAWLLWCGTHWRRDEMLEVHGLAKGVALGIFDEARDAPDKPTRDALATWACQSQTRHHIDAMVALARPDLAAAPAALDVDGWLFNVRNGTIDLRTGQLQPHRRADLITKLAPVPFDAEAACPRWTAFLNRIMAGNEVLIAYLQRVAGMCLTADVREQVLFIFHGKGSNGKSVFLDTLTGLLGDYGAEAPPDLLVVRRNEEHACEVADLQGRRLVVCGETEQGARLRVQLLKRLTGNKFLKARFVRENFFQFERTHKLVLQTNNKPVVRESTHAAWRRIRLVPFDVIIPDEEQDRQLMQKLQSEWPGILNWLVAGCLAWQAGGLATPEMVENATRTYEDEQDLLGEFAEEVLIFTPRAFITRAAAWTAYTQWGQDRREKHLLGCVEFYEALRRRPGVADGKRRVDGKNVRGFAGVGLAPTLPGATGPAEAVEAVPPGA